MGKRQIFKSYPNQTVVQFLKDRNFMIWQLDSNMHYCLIVDCKIINRN